MRNATRIFATLILLGSSLAGCSSPTAPDEAGFNPIVLTTGCAEFQPNTPAVGSSGSTVENSCG